MAITSAGLGSGLDVESIISGLMSIERRPVQAIATQKTAFQSKISAFGTLKSALTSFQTAVSALSSPAKFNAQTVTSSNTSVLTATSNGSATLGNYDITVSQLARSQKLASTGFSNVSDPVGTGTLTISFGKYNPVDTDPLTTNDNTFVANTDKQDITLTIDSSNNSLAGIRDAINAKNASVSASIINDGTTNRLVITSKDTGEVNSLKISVTDTGDVSNTDTAGLSRLAYDPTATITTGKNMLEMQPARDAKLNVDGIAIQKPSNTISDAFDGITLNLLKTSAVDETINLGVATNKEAIQKSVQEFVDTYNKLDTTLRDLTKIDATDKSKNGKLVGDASIRSITTQLRAIMTNTIGSGALTSLNDIGVSFQRDGKLALDSTKLTTAMNENYGEIAKLFSSNASTTNSLVSFSSSTKKTVEGTYAINVTQIGSSTQNFAGTINGVPATGSSTGLTGAPGDSSEGLSVKISGATTGDLGTVSFKKGYAALLDEFIGNVLDTEGTLAAKTEGLNSSIKLLDGQTERLNLRLGIIEARYRAQYGRLDTLISSMNTTSSFLTQQINSIKSNS